jgi:hypothetical protein
MIVVARPPSKFFTAEFTNNEELEMIMENERSRII